MELKLFIIDTLFSVCRINLSDFIFWWSHCFLPFFWFDQSLAEFIFEWWSSLVMADCPFPTFCKPLLIIFHMCTGLVLVQGVNLIVDSDWNLPSTQYFLMLTSFFGFPKLWAMLIIFIAIVSPSILTLELNWTYLGLLHYLRCHDESLGHQCFSEMWHSAGTLCHNYPIFYCHYSRLAGKLLPILG